MLNKLFAPFEAWGTGLRRKLFNDPFLAARYQLMALYLVVSIVLFVLLGWFVSSVLFRPVYDLFQVPSGSPAEAAFQAYLQAQFIRRAALVALLFVATYFLTEFAMRPVRKAAELQKHFIAAASHELRTPLTVMKNMAEVALHNPDTLTKEKAIQIIESNLEETNRLSETVQFLLTSALLRSKNQLEDQEEIVLAHQVERVLSFFADDVANKNITVHRKLDSAVTMQGNKVAIDGLIMNLVKNAVQHTPKGGGLTVTVTPLSKDQVRLVVTNTGTIISKGDMPYIFEPFFRGTTSSGTGFGLGLSIARQAAELHRATIRVRSNKTDGTTFTVTFPAKQ